jgi:hypothetical protein
MHHSITLVDLQLDSQNSYLFTYNTFIKILYVFQALPCSSSGGLHRNCIYMQPLVSSLSAGDCLVHRFFLNLCTRHSFLICAQDSHLQRVRIPEAVYIQLWCRPPEDEQGNAHMGSISLWISFAASIFFAHKKMHNATLFYRGTCIQGRRHLLTAATSVQSSTYRSLCVTIKLDSAVI